MGRADGGENPWRGEKQLAVDVHTALPVVVEKTDVVFEKAEPRFVDQALRRCRCQWGESDNCHQQAPPPHPQYAPPTEWASCARDNGATSAQLTSATSSVAQTAHRLPPH
jgi:hypothetical protein